MDDGGAGDLYVAYVLDRTGSMAAIWEETVSGFRAFVGEQVEQEGETFVTLIAFDHHFGPKMEVPSLGTPARAVAQRGVPKSIVPRGTTPLHDAIAAAIGHAEDWLAARPDRWTGKVLVVVNTDGLENASVEHTRESVGAAIEAKKEEGWSFAFMGAGIDAPTEAEKVGMGRGAARAYDASPRGAGIASRALSASVSEYRKSGRGAAFRWSEGEQRDRAGRVEAEGGGV